MIGLRIAALRKRAGMNQRELAKRLGVSASAVGMYEQGRREPSAEKLVRLAEVLDVSLDYLLTGTPTVRADRRALYEVVQQALRRAAAEGLTQRSDGGAARPVSEQTMLLTLAAMLGN